MDKSDYSKRLEEMYSVDGMSKQGTPTDVIGDISFDRVLGVFQNTVKIRELRSINSMSRKANKKITEDLIADAATYTVLGELNNNDYDEDLEKDIRSEAGKTTEQLSATFRNLKKTGGSSKTDASAVLYSPLKRIIQKNTVLNLQTCEININLRPKADTNDMQKSDMQMSSIVVDAIIFLHNIAGVQIPTNDLDLDHIIGVVMKFIHQKQKLLENLKQILLHRDKRELIKRVIILGCDAYEDGIFWLIVKNIYAYICISERTLKAAQISAFIGTLVERNGFEELAKLLEPLVEVNGFVTKLQDLTAIQ